MPTTSWPEDPVAQLRADRRLLLTGTLDQENADRLCAELMLADGRSADDIELIVNSSGGPPEVLPAVVDVIALLRAPLRTRCIGTATGTAAVVLASGTAARTATPRATIGLRLQGRHTIDGRVDDIRRESDRIARLWRQVADHVADVTDLTSDEAAAALQDGELLTAHDAQAIGLIDGVDGM